MVRVVVRGGTSKNQQKVEGYGGPKRSSDPHQLHIFGTRGLLRLVQQLGHV